MAAMVEITCACGCGKKRKVRVADRNRGWGRYYSKSCKARHQEARTGQYARYLARQVEEWGDSDEEWGDSDIDWSDLC